MQFALAGFVFLGPWHAVLQAWHAFKFYTSQFTSSSTNFLSGCFFNQIAYRVPVPQPKRQLLRRAAPVRRVPLTVAMAGDPKNTPATDFGQVGGNTGMKSA